MVVAKYILENPIRAGLVVCVEDYPFVGSMVYSLADLLEGRRVRVRLKPDTTGVKTVRLKPDTTGRQNGPPLKPDTTDVRRSG